MTALPVIEVAHIAKYFEVYDKPQDRLKQMIFRGRRSFFTPYWALSDITFHVTQGECVGIIGKNGAGKSTLLQIIAGTLTPTAGKVAVRGRVAALLELGSGFNPEFTGRENLYLNATILGLTHNEIDQRLGDILAFADIGDFIDRPVSTYSSGMIVRLAFAVIAHVNADILIVDEALSVGDVFFTKKCVNFLLEFMRKHTVLFVSHDTSAVLQLCNKAILLENGKVKFSGSPREAIEAYLRDNYATKPGATAPSPKLKETSPQATSPITCPYWQRDFRADMMRSSAFRNDIKVSLFNATSRKFGKGGATFTNAWFEDAQGHPLSWIVGGECVTLCITSRALKDIYSLIIGFFIKNTQGEFLFGNNTFLTYRDNPRFVHIGEQGIAKYTFVMPLLPVGTYSVAPGVAEGTQDDHIQHEWMHEILWLESTQSWCTPNTLCAVPMQKACIDI